MSETIDQSILTICTSPTIQRTQLLTRIEKNQVLRTRHTWVDAGGKGIFVSRVLRQLGLPVFHLSHGGHNQQELSVLLSDEGIPHHLVAASSKIRHCITLLEQADPLDRSDLPSIASVTEIVEPSGAVELSTVNELQRQFQMHLEDSSVLVISGSMAPGYPGNFYAELVQMAIAQGLFVILDIRGHELVTCVAHQVHLVKINLMEFVQTFLAEQAEAIAIADLQESREFDTLIESTLAALTQNSRTCFIVTRGSKNLWYSSAGSTAKYDVPVLAKQEIRNPIGSGDAFTAGLAAWVHGHGAKQLFEAGCTRPELIQALIVGLRCAQENVRILQSGRIR